MKEKCKKCEKEYTLGVNGTVDGCDVCEKVVRNRWGQIIFLLLMFLIVGCTPVATAEATVKERQTVLLSQLSAAYAPTATPQVVTLCGSVNVRPGASSNGAVIRWLKAGESVTVLEWREGWARIGAGQWVTTKAVCR
jgi:uncharacterized protein YgiM (DUF1202 family)